MTLKRRIIKQANNQSIENLANELADKPYGQKKELDNAIIRTTITLPAYMLHELEDIAIRNKRKNIEPKSVSALIRDSINNILHK